MVTYRRSFVPGGTFFFTSTLKNRKSSILIDKIDLLKEAIQTIKAQHPFQINAYVILPEHLHMIWQLPEEDANYSLRWKKIKALFSKSLNKSGSTINKTKHNKYSLWQRRFWEHTIRNELDFENHLNYIHYNPIKHGLVNHLRDWPYSSFHYYVQKERISENWAGVIEDGTVCFGE